MFKALKVMNKIMGGCKIISSMYTRNYPALNRECRFEPPKPFKSVWENPDCCKVLCRPDDYPLRHDIIYLKDSKPPSRREYARTWVECCPQPQPKVPVCCICIQPDHIRFRRPRKAHKSLMAQRTQPRAVVCSDLMDMPCDLKRDQPKCPKIKLPHCRPLRTGNAYDCHVVKRPTGCKKRCTLVPAYSECCKTKCPAMPSRGSCRCLAFPTQCEVNAAWRKYMFKA